jgi:thiol-disulfide isomerase/thioredoxin
MPVAPKPALIVALAVLAGAVGLYWFQAGERKVEAPPAPASAMAAFVRKAAPTPLPEIGFQDASGATVTLAQWKGRVVLMNLWATWCGPCRKEMPALAALQKQLGGPDFEVVAVSVDSKGAEASSAFLKETGADSLKLYVDPSTKVLEAIQAIGLPATVLIDRQGNEIGRMLGPAEWSSPEAEALIKAAIAEKPAS